MTALPTRKLEAWRYTDLRPLELISFSAPSPSRPPANLPDLDLPRLVFVNGVYNAEASTPPAFLQPFTTVAEGSLHALAQINAEQASDGMSLAVPQGVDAGAVLLISHADPDVPAALHLRHRITLAAGARLTLIEQAAGQGVYWHNPVFDIALHENAALAHYRLQDESREAFHLATIRAKVAAGATYDSFTALLGARLSRAEFHVSLLGPKVQVHLNAIQLLRGAQHGDFTSVVTHGAPNCASRQTVKAVLSDHARGVFQGRIEVDRVAQKTDGYQMTQALLLSPTAEMDIKPELQIFADDVKCSHGATIGALDPEQIFYLRSRGIAEAQARAMLIRAFLAEALDAVTQEDARALFAAAIETWWTPQ